MAVAFDDTAQFDFTSTNSGSSSPVGTPRAVAVLITENVHVSDVISGVTYGGVAMSREVFIARTSGDEDGAVYGYFLGASIPTGNQTVTCTVSSGTTAKTCYIITFTAAADTEVAGVGSDSGGTGSPSFTIPTLSGFAGSVAALCWAGLANCSNVTLPTGYTLAGSCKDFTSQVSKAAWDDGLSGADIVVAWTTNADDVAAAGMAIQEAAGGAFEIDAAPGSYSVTGAVAAPIADRLVNAVAGSYAVTGAVAAVPAGRVVSALPGAYTVTGTDAGLTSTRLIDTAAGSYAVSGAEAGIPVGRVISAAAGSYTLTGFDADLMFGAGPGQFDLNLDAGAYTLTGAVAGVLADRVVNAAAGSYSTTGTDAGFTTTRVLSALAGSYTLTGSVAGLDHAGGEPVVVHFAPGSPAGGQHPGSPSGGLGTGTPSGDMFAPGSPGQVRT